MDEKNKMSNKFKFYFVPIIFTICLFLTFSLISIHIFRLQNSFVNQQISGSNNQLPHQKTTIEFNLLKWKNIRKTIFTEIIFSILLGIFSIFLFIIYIFKIKKMLLNDHTFILEHLKSDNHLGKNIDLNKIKLPEMQSIAEHFNNLYNSNSVAYVQLIKNQRNLENILNTMTDGILIHKAHGQIIYANSAALKMYGLKERKKLESYPTIKSLSSDKNDPSQIFEYCNTVVQGKSIQFEWIAKNIKTNKEFSVLINLTKITYQNNQVLLANIKDISKLTNARKHLKDEKQLYKTILENISDCIIRTNLDFEVKFINKSTERIINKPLNKIFDKRLGDVIKIIDAKTYKNLSDNWEECILTETNISENDYLIVDWKGKEINVDIAVSMIFDSNQVASGILFVFKDVTEKINYLKKINKIKNLESLGLLASGIAHGFNNILTGVFGNISLAKYYISDNIKAENFLTLAENAMTKAKYLSSKLLTFSESDKALIENFNLDNLIFQIINNLSNHYATKISYFGNPDLWIISADKNQIEQAIVNVLENACEAMSNKGKVKIKTNNFDNTDNLESELNPVKYVKIEIEDRGKGINESHLQRIYDPYFTTKFLGRGLGLTVSYSIITKHSGKIFINSKELFGTKVTIFLPISNIDRNAIKEEIKEIPGKNILLLEKHKSISSLNSKILEDAGFNVIIAENQEELIHLYEMRNEIIDKFDIIIISLKIAEEIDIENVVNRIYSLNSEAKLVLSAYEYDSEKIEKYKKIGFNDVIFEPFNSEKVMKVINKHMKKENVEMLTNNTFKTCSFCGKKWKTREEFLSDNDVKLTGYQVNYIDIEKGLFLFNHTCNTTLAIEVEEFMDLYTGVKYTEDKMNKDGCPGYCLDENNLQDCGNTCYYNQIRKLMLIVLDFKNKNKNIKDKMLS